MQFMIDHQISRYLKHLGFGPASPPPEIKPVKFKQEEFQFDDLCYEEE